MQLWGDFFGAHVLDYPHPELHNAAELPGACRMLNIFKRDRWFFERFWGEPRRDPKYRPASLYVTVLPLALLFLLFLLKVDWFAWVLFVIAMLALAALARFAPQLFADIDEA